MYSLKCSLGWFVVVLTLLFFATGFLATGVPVAAAEVESCCTESGFKLPLPEGWVRIPDKTIQLFAKKVSTLNPGMPQQQFQYAFQPDAGSQWFSYPYIMIQVLETGRVDAAKLAQLQKLPSKSAQVGKKLEHDFATVLTGLKLGEVGYDAEQHIVWSKSSSRVATVGEVFALSGSLLTAKGAIVVHCYAKNEQFAALLPAFEEFVRGIQLIPALQF